MIIEQLVVAMLAPVQSIYVRAGLQERSDNFRDWVYPAASISAVMPALFRAFTSTPVVKSVLTTSGL